MNGMLFDSNPNDFNDVPSSEQADEDWHAGIDAQAVVKGRKGVVSAKAVVHAEAKLSLGTILKILPVFGRLLDRNKGEHQE